MVETGGGEKMKIPEEPCGKALMWWCMLVSLPCSLSAVQTGAVRPSERLDGAPSPNRGVRRDVLEFILPFY